MRLLLCFLCLPMIACVAPPADTFPSDGFVFCSDRVDDDEDGADEPCAATQPADAAPDFQCTGTPPDNVYAYAKLPTNEQVNGGCVFVYQGETGAFYASVSVVDGTNPRGPMGASTGLCSFDYSARRHLSSCRDH